jgi:hypothetical protein
MRTDLLAGRETSAQGCRADRAQPQLEPANSSTRCGRSRGGRPASTGHLLLIGDVLTTEVTFVKAAQVCMRPVRITVAVAYRLLAVAAHRNLRCSPVDGLDLWVFLFGVSPRPFVVYGSSMSPTIVVSTAESGASTVGRLAPRGSLECSPRRGWCGG